jgi:PAS domain S-box-containing protein
MVVNESSTNRPDTSRDGRLERMLEAVDDANTAIAAADCVDEVYDAVCNALVANPDVSGVLIAFRSSVGAVSVRHFAGVTPRKFSDDRAPLKFSPQVSDNIVDLFSTGKAAVGSKIWSMRAADDHDALPTTDPNSRCAVPIRDHRDVVGAIYVIAAVDGLFDKSVISVLRGLATNASFAASAIKDRESELEARSAANAAEHLRHLLLRYTSDVFVLIGDDGNYMWMSDSIEALTGFPPGHYVGRSYISELHPDDSRHIMDSADDDRHWLSSTSLEREVRLRCADGSWRSMVYKVADHRSTPGLGGYLMTGRDVHALREAERNTEFHEQILESIDRAVIATGVDRRISYVNRYARELCGWDSIDQVIGQIGVDTLSFVTGEELGQIMAALANGDSWAGDIDWINPDGTVVPLSVASSLVRDRDSNIIGFVTVGADVTERISSHRTIEKRSIMQSEVARIGLEALRGVDPSSLMDDMAHTIHRVLGVDAVSVIDFYTDKGVSSHVSFAGPAASLLPPPAHHLDGTPVGTDLRSPWVLYDATSITELANAHPSWELAFDSGVIVPIECNTEPWGVLNALSRDRRIIEQDEIDFVQALANVLSAKLGSDRDHHDLEVLALRDPSTGLPTRPLFRDHVDQAIESHQGCVAVLSLGLNPTSDRVDCFGSGCIDDLIGDLATRISALVSQLNGFVGRSSATTIDVLVPSVVHFDEVHEIAYQVVSLAKARLGTNDHADFIDVSVGATSLHSVGELVDGGQLMRVARTAAGIAQHHPQRWVYADPLN